MSASTRNPRVNHDHDNRDDYEHDDYDGFGGEERGARWCRSTEPPVSTTRPAQASTPTPR